MPQGPHDRAVLDAAIAGEPRASDDVAVRAARARLGLEPMPPLEEIAALGSSLAASLAARHAVAGLDAAALERAAALASELARDERELIEAELGRAWSLHFGGAPTFEIARGLELRAGRARIPHAVIDAASLVASAALLEQPLEVATVQARRASRMARTEALPSEEYLAHLILARVRRHLGRPHLSARIATAIARVAPARWRGWLSIELRLSGASDMASRVRARGSDGALDHEPIDALLSGRRADDDVFRTVAPLDQELRALHAAIDPQVPPPPPVLAFLSGQTHELPGTLSGLLAEGKGVRVIASPGGGARRVLWTSAPEGVVELGQRDGAKQHRREAALAQLAFAGEEGLANDELFRRVWGFQFTPHLHQGVLDVLLHRVRAALGDAGELSRKDKQIRLVLERPVALVDPRVEASLEDAVLRALALRGEARARELAEDLAVPLRTVQQALSRLVEGEECHRVGEGQSISYRVEDTTFREPTRV